MGKVYNTAELGFVRRVRAYESQVSGLLRGYETKRPARRVLQEQYHIYTGRLGSLISHGRRLGIGKNKLGEMLYRAWGLDTGFHYLAYPEKYEGMEFSPEQLGHFGRAMDYVKRTGKLPPAMPRPKVLRMRRPRGKNL